MLHGGAVLCVLSYFRCATDDDDGSFDWTAGLNRMRRTGWLTGFGNTYHYENIYTVFFSEATIYYNTEWYRRDGQTLKYIPSVLDHVPECEGTRATYKVQGDSWIERMKPLITAGDGSCGLHAVAMMQFGSQRRADELRYRVLLELICHYAYYDNFPVYDSIGDRLMEYHQPKQETSPVELDCLANILNRQVNMILPDTSNLCREMKPRKRDVAPPVAEPIWLMYGFASKDIPESCKKRGKIGKDSNLYFRVDSCNHIVGCVPRLPEVRNFLPQPSEVEGAESSKVDWAVATVLNKVLTCRSNERVCRVNVTGKKGSHWDLRGSQEFHMKKVMLRRIRDNLTAAKTKFQEYAHMERLYVGLEQR